MQRRIHYVQLLLGSYRFPNAYIAEKSPSSPNNFEQVRPSVFNNLL